MTDYSVEDLERIWNAQPDPMNTWDELGIDEIVVFSQQVARQWQPIETAPMDGTEILLFIGSKNRPASERTTVGWMKDFMGASVWVFAKTTSGGFLPIIEPVTHWMPLPEPPQ